MNDKPELSIVVLSFNNAQYVINCLESITRQDVSSYEVIIVDDSSTDNSVERIRDFIRNRPQFTLIIKEKNSGGAISSQIGIAHAHGEFLAIVDSDDIVVNGAYRVLIDRIKKDGSDFAAGTPVKMLSSFMFALPGKEAPLFTKNRVLESEEERVEFTLQPYYWNIVYKTEFIKSNSIHMPSNLQLADRIFIYQAIMHANKISIDRNITYCWRRKTNDDNQSITDKQSEYAMIVDRCDSFLMQIRLSLEEADRFASMNRIMWGNSIERLLYPLYNLYANNVNTDKVFLNKVLQHYRCLFLEYSMFFYRLIADSDAPIKAKYVIYLIMKNEYERLYDYLTSDENEYSYPRTVDKEMYQAILRVKKNVFLKDVIVQNDKVYLSIGTRGGLEDTDYLTIDNIYAVSRFFEFKRIDLECVDGKVDISSLPPAEYSIRVDYTLMGKSYSEPLASPKDLTIAIDKNYRGYGVRYDTKWALLKIYKKNRFTLMKDNRQILFRVNDATINQLFFYNIQDNKKIDINLDDNRLFRIDFGSFPKGKNVLVYHSEDGGFNTIKFFECSNSDNQRVLFKQIVERDRIEVNV